MVKIKTKNFGTMDIEEKQRITFPEGILGFPEQKEYYLIIKEDSPFLWLQSKEKENLAFVLINPYLFQPEYQLNVSSREWDILGINPDGDDFLIFAIVTIPENPEDMTANLQGPILINPKQKLGVQAISLDETHSIKNRILPALKKALDAGGEK